MTPDLEFDPITGRVTLQVLSHSRTSSHRDCPAKYGYRYVDGLRPRVERDPTRIRGRGLHAGLEAGFKAWQLVRALPIARTASTRVLDAALLDIQGAAGRACADAHREALETLEAARKAGAEVETCDEVRRRLEDGHEADAWTLGHFFGVVVPRCFGHKVPILVEHRFEVPVLDRRGAARFLRWVGVLDLVMYDERANVLEVWEQKTVGTNAGSDEHRRRIEGDPQTTSYVYALRVMQDRGELDEPLCTLTGHVRDVPPSDLFAEGMQEPDQAWARAVPIGAVTVNVLRRKVPTEPDTLKDGTISVKAIDTLPAIYEAALERQPDEPEYVIEARAAINPALEDVRQARTAFDSTKKASLAVQRAEKRHEKAREALTKKLETWHATQAKQTAVLEALRDRGDTFYASIEHFVTPAEVERWRGEQWIEGDRLRRLERHPAERTRNLGHCTSPGRGCTFRSLCYAGGDEQIRATEFTTPDEREEAAVDDDDTAGEDEHEQAAPAAYEAPSWA